MRQQPIAAATALLLATTLLLSCGALLAAAAPTRAERTIDVARLLRHAIPPAYAAGAPYATSLRRGFAAMQMGAAQQQQLQEPPRLRGAPVAQPGSPPHTPAPPTPSPPAHRMTLPPGPPNPPPAPVPASCSNLAQAIAPVEAACSGVAQFLQGRLTVTQFLSDFCTSGCAAKVEALITTYAECIPGSAIEIVTDLTAECNVRPTCYSADVQAQFLNVTQTCWTPLLNLSDISPAAQQNVTRICGASSGCANLIANLSGAHPECFGSVNSPTQLTTQNITSFFNFLCSAPNATSADGSTSGSGGNTNNNNGNNHTGADAYCAWNLRSLGRVDCTANCGNANAWCNQTLTTTSSGRGQSTTTASCSLAVNNTVLAQMCTSCLAGLPAYAALVDEDPAYLTAFFELYCIRADPSNASSNYCLPIVMAPFAAAGPSTTSSSGDSSSSGNGMDRTLDALCDGDTGRCLARYGRLLSSVASVQGSSGFTQCMRRPYGTVAQCQPSYSAALMDAELLARTADLMCATNGNGTRCYDIAQQVLNDPCYFAGAMGLCPAGCAQAEQRYIANASCCLGWVNDYLRIAGSNSYQGAFMPGGRHRVRARGGSRWASYSFSAQHSCRLPLSRSLQPLNAYAHCANTSQLWQAVEGACPRRNGTSAVFRRIKLRVAWELLRNDGAMYARLLSAIRADVANAIGRDASNIREDLLEEEQSIMMLIANSGADGSSSAASASSGSDMTSATSSSGGTTTSHGCSYGFYIDTGASSSDDAAALDRRTSSSAGLSMANTAATCTAQCPSCCGGDVVPTASTDSTSASAPLTVAVLAAFALLSVLLSA